MSRDETTEYRLQCPSYHYPKTELVNAFEALFILLSVVFANAFVLPILNKYIPVSVAAKSLILVVALIVTAVVTTIIVVKLLKLCSSILFFHHQDEVIEFEHPKNTHGIETVTALDHLKYKLDRRLTGEHINILSYEVGEKFVYYTVFIDRYYGVLRFKHNDVLILNEEYNFEELETGDKNRTNCTSCGSEDLCQVGFVPNKIELIAPQRNHNASSSRVALCVDCMKSCASEVSEDDLETIQTHVFAREI